MLYLLIKKRTHLKVWIRLLVFFVLESVVVYVSNQSLYKKYFQNPTKICVDLSHLEAVTPIAGQIKS
jgi:hypothetical protein